MTNLGKVPLEPDAHKGNKESDARGYIKRAKEAMEDVEAFVANHTVFQTLQKYFNPSDLNSMLLNRKDVANIKSKLAKQKRGGHPHANVMDEIQCIQAQLQEKDYLRGITQRKGYAPCIILGEKLFGSFKYIYVILVCLPKIV